MTGIRFVYFLFDFVFQVYGICLRCGIFGGRRGTGKGGGHVQVLCLYQTREQKASLISFIKNFR